MFDKLIHALVVYAIFATGLFATTRQALADDPLVTKAPAPALPTPSRACTSVWGFFVTDCPLSWYGVRVYGTIDTGGGYQTHGAPLDPNYAQGSSYLIQKMNRRAMWTLAPGALSTSAVGVLVDERFAPGWAFIGQLETSFDPYSLELRQQSVLDRQQSRRASQSANCQQRFEPSRPVLQFGGIRRR